jgi:hypothetical protein
MNHLYLTGSFSDSSLSFYDVSKNTSIKLINYSQGGTNTYISKYDLSGTPLWVSLIGGTVYDQSTSICTDDKYIYLTGYFSNSSLVLYSASHKPLFTLNNYSQGGTNTFIAKYNLFGSLLWASVIGGTNSDFGNSICTDDKYIYLTGYFSDPSLVLYDASQYPLFTLNNYSNYSEGGANTFIAKYDLNGAPIWGTVIGGTNSDFGTSICTDDNSLYVLGCFSDASLVLYDPSENGMITLNQYGFQNTFLAKYDLSGNPIWGTVIGGNNNDSAYSICTDNKFLYISGFFSDASLVLYDPSENEVITLNQHGNQNIFLAKYDLSGNPIWGTVIGGNNNYSTYNMIYLEILYGEILLMGYLLIMVQVYV